MIKVQFSMAKEEQKALIGHSEVPRLNRITMAAQ